MDKPEKNLNKYIGRVTVISLIVLVLAMSFVIAFLTVNRSIEDASPAKTNVLVNSNNECVACHRTATPGIVSQYGVSSMASANVKCQDCHQVQSDYPGAIEHEGTFIFKFPNFGYV